MSGRPGGRGGQKVLYMPINFIFKLLTSQAICNIWLVDQLDMKLEGVIKGFDEYMNLVLADAVEIKIPNAKNPESANPRTKLGTILLKGDNVALLSEKQP